MKEKNLNERKAKVLTIVAVVLLLAIVIGAAYAYFTAQVGNGTSANINVTTGTTDVLTFSILDKDVTINGNEATKDNIIDDNGDNAIVINANESNFGEIGTSLGDGITGSAILIAGNDDNIANDTYNVYLNITKNELQYSSYKKNESDDPDTGKNIITYTTEEEKMVGEEEIATGYSGIPELYLTIKKNGTEIKEGITINGKGLSYTGNLFGNPDSEDKTTKTLGGFDITETVGLIKIRINEPISVEAGNEKHTTTDKWEIMITYKNLEYDQNLNTGKKLKGEVIIQKEEYIPEYIKTINKLLADANKENQTTIYFHNAELVGGAEDESYRYAGADDEVKNFVCLDGDTTTEGACGSDDADLYRIIGLFKNEYDQYEMKLIKYEYVTSTQLGDLGAYKKLYSDDNLYSNHASNYKGTEETYNTFGEYYWTSSGNEVNEWIDSELRKTNLNDYYLKTYLNETKGIDIDNLITIHTWSLNGHNTESVTPKIMYDNEMNKIKDSNPSYLTVIKEVKDKIGLIYLSDYGYAVSPSSTNNWSLNISNYNSYKSYNWMYRGLHEWPISRYSTTSGTAFTVNANGTVYYNVVGSYAIGVRPTFYLSSNVQIKSGDGSKNEPYRLELN